MRAMLISCLWLVLASGLACGAAETEGDTPLVLLLIEPQTTYLTEPRRADRTIDYLTYFNQSLAEGVTPEDNAAIPLLRAFGPDFVPEQAREQLGVVELPAEGEYLVTLESFVVQREPADDPDVVEEAYLAHHRARRQALRDPWRPEQFPIVAQWVEANVEPLAWVREATTRSHLFIPRTLPPGQERPELGDTITFDEGLLLEAVGALTARAYMHLGQHRVDLAWQDTMTLHRLARLVAQGQTPQRFFLAAAILGYGLGLTDHINTQDRVTAAQGHMMLEDMKGLKHFPDVMPSLLYVRLAGLDDIQRAAVEAYGERLRIEDAEAWRAAGTDDTGQNAPVDQRITLLLRSVNEWSDRQEEAFSPGLAPQRLARMKRFQDGFVQAVEVHHQYRALTGQQSEATTEGWLDSPDMTAAAAWEVEHFLLEHFPLRVLRIVEMGAIRQDLLLVAAAIEAYWARNRRFPDSLDDLSPDLLPTVPVDRATGKPFRYAPSTGGYTLWSAGLNGVDDQAKEDDIVVRRSLLTARRETHPSPQSGESALLGM